VGVFGNDIQERTINVETHSSSLLLLLPPSLPPSPLTALVAFCVQTPRLAQSLQWWWNYLCMCVYEESEGRGK
jgi:hypothetical protein